METLFHCQEASDVKQNIIVLLGGGYQKRAGTELLSSESIKQWHKI